MTKFRDGIEKETAFKKLIDLVEQIDHIDIFNRRRQQENYVTNLNMID